MKQRFALKRRGTTTSEVIVAATLLLGMIGLVVPTTIRAGRIWKDTRHHQLALNELSNQFEYLSTLSSDQRAAAIAGMELSEEARAALPEARLEAQLAAESDGLRLTLSMNWDRGVEAKPLALIGWLEAKEAATAVAEPNANLSQEPTHEAT